MDILRALVSQHILYRAFELQEPSSTFYTPQNRASLISRLDKIDADVREELKRQGFEGDHVHTERMLNMRFEGTDTALMVLPNEHDGDGNEDFEAAFKRVYKAEFGFLLETKNIIVDDIKVTLHSLLPRGMHSSTDRSAGSEKHLIRWVSRYGLKLLGWRGALYNRARSRIHHIAYISMKSGEWTRRCICCRRWKSVMS